MLQILISYLRRNHVYKETATASGQGEMNYIMRKTAKANLSGLRNKMNKDIPSLKNKISQGYSDSYDKAIKSGKTKQQAIHIARQKGVGVLNNYYKKTMPKYGYE